MSEEKDSVISLDDITEKDIPEKIPTKFINSRVIVFNPLYASYLYVKQSFFGSPLGISKPRLAYFSKPSELSLIEAYYLLINEKITIEDPELNKFLSKLAGMGYKVPSPAEVRRRLFEESKVISRLIVTGLREQMEGLSSDIQQLEQQIPFMIDIHD